MAIPPFPQKREEQLVSWADHFKTKIVATPTTFGLTAGQATAFSALQSAFALAYNTATNPTSNSRANIEIKNSAKQAFLYGPSGAWQLVNIVQHFPGTTNDMRAELNIRIPDTTPTPVPVPSESPVVDVVSTFGTTIRVRVHAATESANVVGGKPAGVKGASLFWFEGANPPADTTLYHFAGNTTKNVYDIVLPPTTAPGAKVWLTAFWFNNRMDSGPAMQPAISVHIPGVMAQAA